MLTPESDDLTPPWPDLLISSGRKAVVPALWVQKQSGGQVKTIHIQNPKAHHSDFDLILAPQHDNISGNNILSTAINIHHVTEEKLETEKALFKARYSSLPQPRVGVLIGGSSKHHTMTASIAKTLAKRLKKLATEGYGLMITASRRTGEDNEAILKEHLDHENIDYWDGSGENPYFGILGWADYLLVTEDSVSMVSEAIATGQPTYIIELKGGSKRLDRFHEIIRDKGLAKPFEGELEPWSPPADKSMTEAVKKVRALLDKPIK